MADVETFYLLFSWTTVTTFTKILHPLFNTLLKMSISPQLRSPSHIFNLHLKLVYTCAHHLVPPELPQCFKEFTVTSSVIFKCLLAVDRLFMLQHSEADCMENQPERILKSGLGTSMRLLPNSCCFDPTVIC